MSDLIKRLRDEPTWYEAKHGLPRPAMEVWHKTAIEAADEIEQKTTAMQNVLDAYDAQTKPIVSIRMSNAIRELRPLLTKGE